MRQIIFTILLVAFTSGNRPCPSVQENIDNNSPEIEGIYDFVSETTISTKAKTSRKRSSPEWSGLFNFQNGYFSIVLLNNKRGADWFTRFPKNISEIGYESFAGTFELQENNLTLRSIYALHPFSMGRTRTFEIRFENDKLILIETLKPYTENRDEGQRVIVLRRLQ